MRNPQTGWYTTPLVNHVCATALCEKRATHEVRNATNAIIGYYCARHANDVVLA